MVGYPEMTKITSYNIILYLLLFLLGCADPPSHSNIFDPDTPNEDPTAVELRTDLITDMTNHSITFDWTESGDEDFYNYKIYRSDHPGVDTSSILLGTHQYPFLNAITDTGLQPNTQYCYKVYTEDKGGLITPSNEICATTAPDIYYNSYIVAEGAGAPFQNHFSRMDVVTHAPDNTSTVFYAVIHQGWGLSLWGRDYNTGDPGYTTDTQWYELMFGDSDDDGQNDLFEIYGESDREDPDDVPDYWDMEDFPHITPRQVVVFKEPSSTSVSVFILLTEISPYNYSKILKFTGDLADPWSFSLDTTNWGGYKQPWGSWPHPQTEVTGGGVLKIAFTQSIAKYSSDILLVGYGWGFLAFDLSGNELFYRENDDVQAGFMSVGKDSPNGYSYIYLSDWEGRIYKFDLNGNIITWWQGFNRRAASLIQVGFFADNRGNVFISDTELGTVNRYNSSDGEFISRWGTINRHPSWDDVFVNYPFYFDYSTGVVPAALAGDDVGLFIIDMNTYKARALY